jgi:hypothetical protein
LVQQWWAIEAGAKFSASHLRVALGQAEASAGMAHLGGGGERFFTCNLGVGADLGYLTSTEQFSGGFGTFSPNFVARFPHQSSDGKVEPFLTGGYTLFFRSGTANGLNFGGGLNYWFKERIGLRFEVRDNVMIPPGGDSTSHFVGFRIGLAFR